MSWWAEHHGPVVTSRPSSVPPGVAVVTGGSRGIGAATCRRLATSGLRVVVAYRSDAAAAAEVAADCGPDAVAVAVDVADAGSIGGLFEAADERGRLAVLVNNAGIAAAPGRVDELDPARIAHLFQVNVVGAFVCAGEAVRRMSTRHGGAGGAIVNVSSTAARLGSAGEWVDYAATKGAIDTMTLGLAKEVATEGIRVNAVRPGLVDTDFHATVGQPDRPARMAPQIPMQRAGMPDEIASAIAWLCSAEASYVTGALLDVGGGR